MSIPPNEYLFSTVFKLCTRIGDSQAFEYGKSLWNHLPASYENNRVILTSALHMFMQNGDISTAEKIFDKMEKDRTSYGAIMSGRFFFIDFSLLKNYFFLGSLFYLIGYIKNNQAKKAIENFFKIKDPDEINLMLFFSACSQLKTEEAFNLTKEVFHQIFNKYSRKSNTSKALYAALHTFVAFDDMESAEMLFFNLKKDIVCYNLLMKTYNEKNQSEKVFDLFQQIQRDKIKPNEITFVLIINACSRIGNFSLCRSILPQIPKKFFKNIFIQNALIDMWVRKDLFERLIIVYI